MSDRRYVDWKIYVDALRADDQRAIEIAQTAAAEALGLARAQQDVKDELANGLRQQIASERGMYTTHDELNAAVERIGVSIKPLADYITAQIGRDTGAHDSKTEHRLDWSSVMQIIVTCLNLHFRPGSDGRRT